MNECFLGLDIGTGSSKGAIVDIEGNVLCQASVPHEMSMPQPGWYEQDADRIWWGDFLLLCRKLLDNLQHTQRIDQRGGRQHHRPLCTAGSIKRESRCVPGFFTESIRGPQKEIREIEEKLGQRGNFCQNRTGSLLPIMLSENPLDTEKRTGRFGKKPQKF